MGTREVGIEEALDKLRLLPYQDLGFAKIDHHRTLRKGAPEVVLGEGKTPDQIAAIAKELAARENWFLITRADPQAYDAVKAQVPDVSFNDTARAIFLDHRDEQNLKQGIVLVSAGTADMPVAEEAALTCELMSNEVERVYDVGIAGLHRLLDHTKQLQQAKVIIVVAGMEGALPGLVGGLVSAPVIAVPTSVGYGVGLGGLAALMTMLSTCAPGVAVVNIDNGFGAGYLASIINQQRGEKK